MGSRDLSSIKIALGFALSFCFLVLFPQTTLTLLTHAYTSSQTLPHTKLSKLDLQIGHCDQAEY